MADESDKTGEGVSKVVEDDPAEVTRRAQKLVGTLISDRYRLHNLLAVGGMGAVYTGEHVHMRKRVAVKLLHPEMANQAALIARFEREAIVGAHVEHKNVAAARDFGRLPDGICYLVLEFVRGVTLRQLINQGPISVRRAARIARQIAEGLGAVHERGIFHRDVAPRNVMVLPGPEDRVKLIDFGFAKVPVERFAAMSIQGATPIMPSEITSPGVIFGTIGYLAPEGVFGMKAVNERSDLYALGSILYEMLAGVPPFEAETQALLFLKHRTEPAPRIRDRAPGVEVPRSVENIALRLLKKNPEERFANAAEVMKALDEAMAELAPESKSMPPPTAENLELTVIGAEAPVSLPRFEDVCDVTLEEPAEDAPKGPADKASKKKPSAPSAVPKAKAESAEPKRGSIAPFAIGLLLLAGGGAGAAYHFGVFGPKAGPEAAASSAASAPSVSAPGSAAGSPTASSSASLATAPSASAAEPALTEVDGLDAEAWKLALKTAPSTNNYEKALASVLALAKLDKDALKDATLRANALETTVRFGNKEPVKKLIDVLATSFGSDGLDILYEVMTKRGGSAAAALATEQLKDPVVRARATKALLVAMDLRDAPCAEKVKLLDRALAEGDARTLGQLAAARAPACDSSTGACCLKDNAAVETTVRELTKKTEGGP